jgi:diguanylate cyclase (GGDEF)-like protein/putative nucleotidyltransferase with HDIG domain
MVHASRLSRFGPAYVRTVIVLGLAVVAGCVYQMLRGPVPLQWFLIAALTLASGSATVQLPSSHASISISEVFVFLAILLYGPAAGTVVVALDGLVISFWLAKRHSEAHRAFFNMSAPAVSAWCSAQLFFLVSGLAPLATHPATLNQVLPSLALSTLVYFALNTWLITFAIAFERQVNALRLWVSSFAWLSLTYLCGASVAALVAVYNTSLDFGFIGVIVPLLLILYFTFRTTMGRLEDAHRHVGQLNNLYLSTIETLAMAIDAKDQVTHGHIRRVQNYAVGLAQFVGVTDQGQVKAIEAAALLHDMGKLAVPEYILNKPGKLTPAEFEKMKLHASVGADILSAIAFPYPVVPIVRHHHESWDGTGYPAGLSGTDIPIGARILAVVDCFDALTSDRPYRPRLSDEEAVAILLERRGSMYDPLIVDTFVRVHNEITTVPLPAPAQHDALNEISNSAQDPLALPGTPRLDEIAASADEMLTLYDLARALAGQASIADTGDVIAKHLRRLIPSSLCIFFLYDPQTDDLEAAHAFGEASSMVRGFRIALGQRLSGWVAANQQTIVNSDPSLDLGDVARAVTPRLRSCLSTPMLAGDQLVGVLSVYSALVDGFNEDHRRVIEAVAKQIGHTFKRATDSDAQHRRDALTGLPNVAQLEHLLDGRGTKETGEAHVLTLLLVEVVELKRINTLYGRDTGDDALRHVVRHTRAGLRITDLLFQHGSDEFVVLLNEADAQTAARIASSIRDNVRSQPITSKGGNRIAIDVTITCVAAPTDGASFPDLIATARARAHAPSSGPTSIH